MAAFSSTSSSCSGNTGTTQRGLDIFCVRERSLAVGNDAISFSGDLHKNRKQKQMNFKYDFFSFYVLLFASIFGVCLLR